MIDNLNVGSEVSVVERDEDGRHVKRRSIFSWARHTAMSFARLSDISVYRRQNWK